VQLEKQPLLANGSETTFVSRLRLGKQVPTATDTHAIIVVLLETVFSTRSMQRSYIEGTTGRKKPPFRNDLSAEG
jgi:hypothetical protein